MREVKIDWQCSTHGEMKGLRRTNATADFPLMQRCRLLSVPFRICRRRHVSCSCLSLYTGKGKVPVLN